MDDTTRKRLEEKAREWLKRQDPMVDSHEVDSLIALLVSVAEETRRTVEAEFRNFADQEFEGIRSDAYLRDAYRPYACGLVHEMWKRNTKTEERDTEWEQVVKNVRPLVVWGRQASGEEACDEILKRMGRLKERERTTPLGVLTPPPGRVE